MHTLIVGGGPTGLTAGIELARLGVDVELIEKRSTGSGFSRAVGIFPSSLEILEPSGVAKALIDEGIIYKNVKFFNEQKLLADISIKIEDDPSAIMLALAQDRTEHHLREAFERLGGKFRYASELTDFSQNEKSVTAIINGQEEISCDYMIAADGIHSHVRKKLGIAFPGHDLPEKWSIADVDVDHWQYPETFTICRMAGGKVAVVGPIEANRCRIIANEPGAITAMPLPINITNIRREGEFTISVRQAERYQKGRIFLAGDAAHCHSPVGGRGMNLGISDAADIAKRIHEGTTDGYHDVRHPEGVQILKFSEAGRKFATATDPFRRGLFRLVMFAAHNSKWLQKRIARQLILG